MRLTTTSPDEIDVEILHLNSTKFQLPTWIATVDWPPTKTVPLRVTESVPSELTRKSTCTPLIESMSWQITAEFVGKAGVCIAKPTSQVVSAVSVLRREGAQRIDSDGVANTKAAEARHDSHNAALTDSGPFPAQLGCGVVVSTVDKAKHVWSVLIVSVYNSRQALLYGVVSMYNKCQAFIIR